MLDTSAVRNRLGWGKTIILVCALSMLASACSSDSAQRLSAETEVPADKSAKFSSPQILVEPTKRLTKMRSDDATVQEQPWRSGLIEPEFYLGSGALVRFQDDGNAEAPVSEHDQISLNFVNVDIREMVAVVLGDTLNVNYMIDPEVRGTVVARTSNPLEREHVIPALENILALNGVALRLVDGIYQILPLEKASRSSIQPRTVVAARLHDTSLLAQIAAPRHN